MKDEKPFSFDELLEIFDAVSSKAAEWIISTPVLDGLTAPYLHRGEVTSLFGRPVQVVESTHAFVYFGEGKL